VFAVILSFNDFDSRYIFVLPSKIAAYTKRWLALPLIRRFLAAACPALNVFCASCAKPPTPFTLSLNRLKTAQRPCKLFSVGSDLHAFLSKKSHPSRWLFVMRL
jgi:hypothetical protein